MKKINMILPGFLACLVLMLVSKEFAKFMPQLGAAPIAIFMGIIAGNSFFKSDRYAEGSRFSETDLLSYSIVLLGGSLGLDKLGLIGFRGVGFIVFQLSITLVATLFIGKKLGFNKKFCKLMASGNAVCGSSAIGAVAPVVEAEADQKAVSITIVNLIGTLLLFLLPFISQYVMHYDDLMSSAMIGGILQSVGQVVASGAMVNEHVLELSTIFKIVRILFLVAVVYLFSRGEIKGSKGEVVGRRKLNIPWYILCFFAFSIFTTLHIVPQKISVLSKTLSNQLELIALVGIGMRVKIIDLVKQGPIATLYGLLVASVQVIAAIALIRIFFK